MRMTPTSLPSMSPDTDGPTETVVCGRGRPERLRDPCREVRSSAARLPPILDPDPSKVRTPVTSGVTPARKGPFHHPPRGPFWKSSVADPTPRPGAFHR